MMRPIACSLALLAFLSPVSALAAPVAVLEVMQGHVLVDKGDGFTPVPASASVVAGNRIMVMSGSSAILSSPETGCVLSLRDPGQFVVPPLEDCAAGQAGVLASNIQIIPANGVYEPVVLVEPPPPPFVPAPVVGIAPVVAGGAFVAGVAGAFVMTQVVNTEEKPKSAP